MSKSRGLYHLVADDDNPVQLTKSTGKGKILFLRVVVCIVVILLVVSIGIALAIYFAVSSDKKSKNTGTNNDCITPNVCNSKLLEYIDDSIDPCEDFYNYSCGNWLSANPLNNRSVLGTFYSLSLDNYDHLEGYLSRPVREGDSTAIKKTKYIYSACKDVDYIQSHLVDYLQGFTRLAGGWESIGITPDRGWRINNNLVDDHYQGSSAFFGFGIVPDDLNSTKPVIKVSSIISL